MAAIPLVVCDDSGMARKQLIRALPADWPVSITQATNGKEGLKAIMDGLGQVVLLDLTMPEMDGYQVLQMLKANAIDAKVIVVSGDVQEEAVRRVTELGALAFLKKPAAPEQVRAILEQLGLYAARPADAPLPAEINRPDFKVGFRDAFREVNNVAMGQAAALLAKALGVFVQLPIPNVNIFEVGELSMALADIDQGQRLSAVCQGYIGDGIAGEALLIFHDSEVADIAKLLGIEHLNSEVQEQELLMDLASILIGACLSGIARQLDVRFSQGHPQMLGQHCAIGDLMHVNKTRWKKTLAVEISYSIEGMRIHFDLLLLFTEDSVKRLTDKISHMMD